MQWKNLLKRFKEPSSWASIALLISVYHPELGQALGEVGPILINAVITILLALGIMLPEKDRSFDP